MPFTLAHPAIVLPLVKSKRFSATALLAGSMVPDFEFFFQLREVENIGHHWQGTLLFDLPVALLFCYLYHYVLRNLFIGNLPAFLRYRFVDTLLFDWNSFAAANRATVGGSLLIGIASHLLWDGFTHYDGFFVAIIPLLSAKATLLGFEMPVYFLLQLLCSLLGVMVVLWGICQLPVRRPHSTAAKRRLYWPAFLLVFLLVLALRVAAWPQYNSFAGIIMAIMGSICYAWLFVSVSIKLFTAKKNSYEHNS
jgi:hypothetical protein